MNRRIIISIAIYIFINVLFVYKYSIRFLSHPWLWIVGYPLAICALVFIFTRDFELKTSQEVSNALFISTVVLIAVILTLGMRHFNPAQIRVTRYPALHDWITRLLNGQYPYTSTALPSGFPVLFLIAVPFYVLGDLGLLQIFAFLIYAHILHRRFGSGSMTRMHALLLLLVSPVFLYEIAVRSDLFSNMVLVIAFMVCTRDEVDHARIPALAIMGIIGGLLLATRGIVLLIFLIYYGYLFKNQLKRGMVFACALVSGFTISCIPFVVWDAGSFLRHGPFAIQTSYLPIWLTASFVILGIFFALRADSLAKVYGFITWMLVGAVGMAFLISLHNYGWSATIHYDRFDVSYFCFALPFLLLLDDYGHKASPTSDRFFSTARNTA